MEQVQEQLLIILSKLGLNKNGNPNGNGLINEIKEIKSQISDIKTSLHNERIEKVTSNIKLENIESEIVSIQSTLTNIENNLKDNINMRSFIKIRNVLVGIVAVIGAFGAIGTFLYNFLKIFYERGN